MSDYWKAHAKWQGNPAVSLQEAERRVATCAETRSEALYLGDLSLEELPEGLSALTWLKELRASGGPVTDLSSLAPLANLTLLEIGSLNCPFPGLGFATGWSKLESLRVITPSDVDMAPLASCSRLKRLTIWSTQNRIQLSNLNIVPIGSLEHLSLYGTQSDEFDMIARCHRLTFLQLIGANVASLAGFEKLKNLQHVSVDGAPVSDITPLGSLLALEEITLRDLPLRDISPLAGLPLLHSLTLSKTQVADLIPLERLAHCQKKFQAEKLKTEQYWFGRRLRDLDIDETLVTDLTPLAQLSDLERLSVSDTALSSLDALIPCKALRSLDISRTAVKKLGAAGSLRHLSGLNAAGTPIDNLAALAPASSLQWIDITNTAVADLTPLQAARHCRSLKLRGSQVRDLDPILHTGSELSQDRGDSREFLDFRDTPASQVNERFAELAMLAAQGPEKCFHETKAYLRERAERGGLSVARRLFGLFRSSMRPS